MEKQKLNAAIEVYDEAQETLARWNRLWCIHAGPGKPLRQHAEKFEEIDLAVSGIKESMGRLLKKAWKDGQE